MSLHPVIVHAGLRHPGGVSTDARNLLHGLCGRGHRAALVGSLSMLRRELTRPGRAVVHVFGCLPSTTTFGAMALARSRRLPLVWTPIFHPSRPSSWAGYGPLRAMELFDRTAPYAARLTDAVLAETEAEATYFASLGAPRVEIVPPAVPAAQQLDGDAVAAFRSTYGLGRGPVVLTVARDSRRKGLSFGLATFERVRSAVPDAQLLLVGPAADHPASQVAGVRVAGWLDPGSVAAAYAAADLVFVPSAYESFCRAVIEGWREGVPAVVTDRVALAPTVDGAGGVVVPYGNADLAASEIADLLTDEVRRRRLGRRGRSLVGERFQLDSIVTATERCYREVLGEAA